jgi:hypothetical protein
VDGGPLYFASSSSGIERDALRIDQGPMAEYLANLHKRRADDEQLREQLRAQASRKRADRVASDCGSIIDGFNRSTKIADLLARYGYDQSPGSDLDWRSPHQASTSYATRVLGDKWVSLSSSDAAAGLGARCEAGCYGDAFDLFVHYENRGDPKAAWRQLCLERETAGSAGTTGRGTAGQHPEGWQEVPPGGDGFEPEAENLLDERAGGSADQRAHSAPAEPVDLWARYESARLPVGLLPRVIEQFAFQQGELKAGRQLSARSQPKSSTWPTSALGERLSVLR